MFIFFFHALFYTKGILLCLLFFYFPIYPGNHPISVCRRFRIVFFFDYLFTCLIIFGCTGSSLLPACFLWLWWAGATLSTGAPVLRSFSLWWFLSLWSTGSKVLGLSSWGMQAELRCGMWDLLRWGIKLTSLVLAGGFLTYWTTMKVSLVFLNSIILYYINVHCFFSLLQMPLWL